MKTTMRFEGGAELASHLAELSVRVQKGVLLNALKQGAEPIRTSMERLAPRSTEPPHVGDNIVIGSAREKGVAASVAVGPSANFEPRARIYPVMQELGTAFHQPQPFARPAFDSDAPKALPIISGAIWRALISRGIGSGRASGESGLL